MIYIKVITHITLKIWYRESVIARIDGPAIIIPELTAWIVDNKLHRPFRNGPAIVYANSEKAPEYRVDGIRIDKQRICKE